MLEVIYDERYGVCQPDGLIPDWISNYFFTHHDDILLPDYKLKLYTSSYQFIDDLILFLDGTEIYSRHVNFFYHDRECFKVKKLWNTIDFHPYEFRRRLDEAKYRNDMMPNKISTSACTIDKTYVESVGHYQYIMHLSS